MSDSFTSKDIEILEQASPYQGYFRIKKYRLRHRLFRGGWSAPISREIFERGHAVGVLLFDPQLNKIVLIEQLRMGAYGKTDNPWLLELVAGMVGKDEVSEAVAIRETKEETGLNVLDLIPICDYWVSPGGSTEKVTLFCGRVDASQIHTGDIHGLAEENEDIRVQVMNVAEVYAALANGHINNSLSIIALQWFQLHEKKVREKFYDKE
jgi:ADP-ribose pyrophosphatase